ncbi:TatD family hydrolase [Patescibacteria group bacterium]|nr:TatD family hydrolase [Patescibacteria group bacterium]MBU1758409.1 TatD family hydrolase [Patescibacteria group bacterium]
MGVKLHRLFIGFCGNVSYKSADNLREALKIVHLDSLLLETDAPFLAPQVVRGQTNEPAFVKYIYEFVAEYLSMDIEKLAQQCEHNFKELYNV